MVDKIEIEILEDGMIKITTGEISKANHCNADELIGEIEKLAGGERQREKKIGHVHTHGGIEIVHKH